MFGSIHLGSVFGIQVRMHWLFAVFVGGLLWFGAIHGQEPLQMLLQIAIVLALVFLHELGHSLVARRFGIRVLDITFWPLGGMARMSEIPENSKVEGLVAIAGPAVNLGLAFLAAPIAVYSRLAVQTGEATPLLQGLWEVSGWFLLVNLLLGVFNLIPAFPMDGGRLLRAWLGRRGDWVRATALAVRVGRVLAFLMVGFGLFTSLWGVNLLPLIGLFVWFSGAQELAVVRARHAHGAHAAPGVGSTASAAFDAPPPASGQEAAPDPSGARRPRAPWAASGSPEESAARGFSAADLESLEHYPGPLRRPSPD